MNSRVWVAAVAFAVGVLAVVAAAQTPEIKPETKALRGELNASQTAEVDAFLRFCANRMAGSPDAAADAVSPKVIAASRQVVIAAYGTDNGDGYMRYFAQSAAENFARIALRSADPLVLVNASLVLSRLTRPEIAPALDQMVVHPNPAVRYYGAATYATIREGMLIRGPEHRDRMFTALRARAGAETSPVVSAVLFGALDLSGSKAIFPVLGPARVAARETLAELVKRNLQAVRDGEQAMCTAYGRAVATVRAMAEYTTDKPGRVSLLQTLADIMANAGQAYLEQGKSSKGKSAAQLSQLLIDCEQAMSQITGEPKSQVARVLRMSGADRGARVKYEVNNWVGTPDTPGVLTALGVTPPAVLPSSTSPAVPPTTAPAAGAAAPDSTTD